MVLPRRDRYVRRPTYAAATHVEGLSEGQPGQHPGEGLSGHRVERDDLLQPAPQRVPDPDQAEEVVPEVRARGHHRRGRQGLRVREGPLGRRDRRGHRQGPDRVDQGHQPGAVRRRRRRSTRCTWTRRTTWRPRRHGRRRLRGDARRHAGQGRHRQGGHPRPRVPGGGQAAQAGPGDVHAAPRRRDPHHRSDRRAARSARQGRPGGDEAGQAGDRELRGRARPRRLQGRVPGRAAGDHRRQGRGRRGRRAGGRGAAEGRRSDGSAAPQPRSGQQREEEDGEGRGYAADKAEAGGGAAEDCGGQSAARRNERRHDDDSGRLQRRCGKTVVVVRYAPVPPSGASAGQPR